MKNVTFVYAVLFMLVSLSATFAQSADTYTIVSNILKNGQSLKQGEALRSPNSQYAAVMQRDGNFCLYKLAPNSNGRTIVLAGQHQFMKCTMTVGNEDKKGSVITMQGDGNLALYNSKKQHLWSTDTFKGGDDKVGKYLVMYDDGNLQLISKKETGIWNFKQGRLYQ